MFPGRFHVSQEVSYSRIFPYVFMILHDQNVSFVPYSTVVLRILYSIYMYLFLSLGAYILHTLYLLNFILVYLITILLHMNVILFLIYLWFPSTINVLGVKFSRILGNKNMGVLAEPTT